MLKLIARIDDAVARCATVDMDNPGWHQAPKDFAREAFADLEALFASVTRWTGPLDEALVIADSTGAQPALYEGLAPIVHRRTGAAALVLGHGRFSSAQPLGAGARAEGHISVLSPGEHLGLATQIEVSGSQIVVEGARGHAGLSPGNHLEAELWGVLATHHDHVTWGTVLSRGGLVNLYRAMCAIWGSAPEDFDATQICALGRSMEDMVCHQAVEAFCGMLGAAAGDYAMTMNARSVYLAGGLLPQLGDFVATSPIRRRFDEKGDQRTYMETVSLTLVLDEDAELIAGESLLKRGA